MGFSRQEYWSGLPLLQGIFLTQESNLGLLHFRQTLYQLSYQGSPVATRKIVNSSGRANEYDFIALMSTNHISRITTLKYYEKRIWPLREIKPTREYWHCCSRGPVFITDKNITFRLKIEEIKIFFFYLSFKTLNSPEALAPRDSHRPRPTNFLLIYKALKGTLPCFFKLVVRTFKFIYFWWHWAFIVARRLSPVMPSMGYSYGAWASQWSGFSCCWAWVLGVWASAVVAHRLSCSTACGIFLDQGWNTRPLPWQAGSYPLYHQGSPHYLI